MTKKDVLPEGILMKNSKLKLCIAALLFFVAGPAFAVPTISLTKDTYQYGNGGPFKATLLDESFAGYSKDDFFPTFVLKRMNTSGLATATMLRSQIQQ